MSERQSHHPLQPYKAHTSYASLSGILAKMGDGTPGIEKYVSIEKTVLKIRKLYWLHVQASNSPKEDYGGQSLVSQDD